MSLRLRRGGVVASDPPVTPDYGPLSAPQVIIDGVGPRTVTSPPGAIPFATWAALDAAIDANPNNSQFVATASSYAATQITWTGERNPRIYFPGGPGAYKVIDGGGADIAGISAPSGTTLGFEVYGGQWQNFGTSTSVNACGVRLRGNCTVSDARFINNLRGVSSVTAGVFMVTHNQFIDNFWMGVANSFSTSASIFEYNDLDHNNTALFNPGGSASGGKFLECSGTWRYNYAHNNLSWGLWWDTAGGSHASDGGSVLVSENVAMNNGRPGLFYERSIDGRLTRNFVSGNGSGGTIGGQIQTASNAWEMLVRNGTNVEVDRNDIDGDGRLFAVAQQSNEFSTGINIHDNRIWLREASGSRVGGYDDNGVETLWTTPITWDRTLYMVASTSNSYWQWGPGEPQIDWTQWLATAKDANGTRQVI